MIRRPPASWAGDRTTPDGVLEQQRRNWMHPVRSRRWLRVLTIVTFVFLAGTPHVWAQDEGNARHPAHIHDGSCANLGGIALPLNDVTYGGMATNTMTMGGTPAANTSLATPA